MRTSAEREEGKEEKRDREETERAITLSIQCILPYFKRKESKAKLI